MGWKERSKDQDEDVRARAASAHLGAVKGHVGRVAHLRVRLAKVLLRVERVKAHASGRAVDEERAVARLLEIDLR